MLKRFIDFAIRQRVFVILATLFLAVLGVYNFQKLPIDAMPDITNIQVQINTEAPGYSPIEVEQRVTYYVETAMFGLPRLKETWSISRYGLSQVTVIFEDGTDIYFARQLVNARLRELGNTLPDGLEPIMGPIATGLGEIYMWALSWQEGHDHGKTKSDVEQMAELRTVQEWTIRPQLMTIPGVVEVNSIGGYKKQYHVTPDPKRLTAYNLTFNDIVDAVRRNNDNVGAGYIEQSGEQYLVRTPGQVKNIQDIENIVVGAHRGVPIYIRDVADVLIGKELRTGAATRNGKEVVLGTVFMLKGDNSRRVSRAVDDKMQEIARTLPEGVQVTTTYDRTKLVNKTLTTVRNNLTEGALLVVVVLFLLLGNFRAAFITALVIPLSMLFAVTGMVTHGVSGNLLSLGAVDFGIIVDGTVIIMENCIRRLTERQRQAGRELSEAERLDVASTAAAEVSRPSIFGVIIIMIVYIPILTLTGVEGKMFIPMAFTVLAALTGALILSLTFIPAMVVQFISGRVPEKKTRFFQWAQRMYRPVLTASLKAPVAVLTLAGVLFVLTIMLATQLGREFVPTLNEEDHAIHALRIPGTSLSQAVSMQHNLENKLHQFPEVDYVFSKIGTPDIATDPMPPSVADVFVIMKPRREWPDPNLTRPGIIEKFESVLNPLPGNKYEFTQPIQMRFNELISGVRSDVAVKVHGDDLEVLLAKAEDIAHALETIPGAADVRVEQVTGLSILTVKLKRGEMARLGFNVSEIQSIVQTAVGGRKAGVVYEGDNRYDLVVRLPEDIREKIPHLRRIPLPFPKQLDGGHSHTVGTQRPQVKSLPTFIPLEAVADLEVVQGPNQISRENGKRRVFVSANVRGRDLGTFVEEAQALIRERVTVPSGYWLTWGGQFEHLISATQRLYLVVPVALLLIFLLLMAAFGSARQALLVFSGVPLALTGGVFAIWARGIPLSISAAVGFIALSGVAVLNGVVLVSYINSLRQDGMPLDRAVYEGCLTRLRPVLMTALVASLGFLPMATATGTGAEVQQPLATVVIGGIVSATLLTLVVLPVLYRMFMKEPLPMEERKQPASTPAE
ncbi:Cation efflux system protein CzcA [Nitrospina gracilis 3/211]|uniref:Cation efflux system protein CzcA n=1 Tax=Nitrospina gracilis (strain 3/211) TaxID=1266370 RepID=M1YHA6_NITG3|nr:CusA/CzcA family heavy metal efflux RND transporter [Nitrospina gracilis]MCF8722887.1 cobalt-zinc-cadmium resistance protein CzcA [Nitrospina sp. Nb-3]CCQ89849.1 Cation efflux system protein CzcA [Nitrospina gracilis 3/211]